jgi:general secretion pathway protein E
MATTTDDAGSALNAETTPSQPKRLGELVFEQGIVNAAELDFVLQKQAVEEVRLGNLLVSLGLATQKDVARLLAYQRGHSAEYLDRDVFPEPDPGVAKPFNQTICLTHGFLPLQREEGALTVMLGDGDPEGVARLVRRRTGWEPRFLQGEFARVAQAIRQHFFFAENPPEKVIGREIRQLERDVDRVYSPENLLGYILTLAVRERATDIHLTASPGSRHVLFRIDGVLRPMFAISEVGDRVTSYVKLCSEMDIAEQRLPQDGSFSRVILDQPYTIRVSTIIAEYGERMVMRLLPERNNLDKLSDLGVIAEDVAELKRLFSRPQGMILLTGPTGSGKSTTLHAALRMQQVIERNVLTVEDPVEYRVPAVGQTEVNPRAGYDFSNALRHFLRHDPDIILLGEIRDAATAQAATDASSTGHLVLSTLHVGSIFGVVPRLKLLGVNVETIAENLMGVINQRLVRRNCPLCVQPTSPSEAEREWLGLSAGDTVYQGVGCERCRHTGYLGRMPVYEMLLPDQRIADAIALDASRGELRALCEEAGMRTIVESGRQRVLDGETSVEELQRTIGEGVA